MSQTYIGSALRTGSGTLTDSVDGGFTNSMQTGTVTTLASGLPSSVSFTIPAYAQILNFLVDMVTVPSFGTATTVPATIGTAVGGSQYLTITDASLTGRTTPVFTSAQVAAMADVGTNQTVVFTLDPNGTVATQGVFRLTVVYAQKV